MYNDYDSKHKIIQEAYVMKKAAYNIVPTTEEILKNMGEQIKLARLRRDLSGPYHCGNAGEDWLRLDSGRVHEGNSGST